MPKHMYTIHLGWNLEKHLEGCREQLHSLDSVSAWGKGASSQLRQGDLYMLHPAPSPHSSEGSTYLCLLSSQLHYWLKI